MLLRSIEITDFLSIKGSTTLLLDKTITVLLGSNDHGKSNLLKALQCLNEDCPIKHEDVNWDAEGTASLNFTFALAESEQHAWAEEIKKLSDQLLSEQLLNVVAAEEMAERSVEATLPTKGPVSTVSVSMADVTSSENHAETRFESIRTFLTANSVGNPPESLILSRRGVGNQLSYRGIPIVELPEEIQSLIRAAIPRVELFKTLTGELQDSVSMGQLLTDEFEFMQGLFFYAGVDPAHAGSLFEHNDETERQIQNASKMLDENLRRLWGQGTQLTFSLAHRNGKIEFLADDPSITKRKARMSKRSDGVTQFFRTSILLHARRKKHPANSYLYLFDEPGVYLHPQGQKDLLQVFEQLGADNQIVYATHSLFMLNQNFPERHRLVIKGTDGTKIDAKPHRANWRLATDALGVFLTSNILFSSHVLFVEGDSDCMYLFEFFRLLNRFGEIDADINRLGIMSFSDIQNLKFLLQVIRRDGTDTQAMVLFDGDREGAATSTRVTELCERLSVKRVQLEKGKSIEDYCFHEPTIVGALTRTLREARESSGENPADALEESVKKAWSERKASLTAFEEELAKRMTGGKWFLEVSKKLIQDEASKVALARNYVLLCREVDDTILKQADYVLAKTVCSQIADGLKIPKRATEAP